MPVNSTTVLLEALDPEPPEPPQPVSATDAPKMDNNKYFIEESFLVKKD